MRDVMRQIGRGRFKRLLVLGSVCGGLAIAMMRLASEARAAEAASFQTEDCSLYIDPPPECQDEADAASSYGNDGYYDPDNFPWPATFDFWGSINGHLVVGTATRQGTSSSYNAEFDAVGGGDDCFGTMIIDLSWAEAAYIEMGIATNLSSWSVTSSWF